MPGIGIGQGLQILKAGQDIAEHRNKLEKEQDDKDVYAAMDLLKQVEESAGDDSKIRQLEQQFTGYNPRVRHNAQVQYMAMKDRNRESMQADIQFKHQNFVKGLRQGVADFSVSEEKGLKTIASLLTDADVSGDSYEIKSEGNGFMLVNKDHTGKVVAMIPMDKQKMLEFASQYAGPDTFLKEYVQQDTERQNRIAQGLMYENMARFIGSDGTEYRRAIVPDRRTGIATEVWWAETDDGIVPTDKPKDVKALSEIREDEKFELGKKKIEADIRASDALASKRQDEKDPSKSVQESTDRFLQKLVLTKGWTMTKDGTIVEHSTDPDTGETMLKPVPKEMANKLRKLADAYKKDLAKIMKERDVTLVEAESIVDEDWKAKVKTQKSLQKRDPDALGKENAERAKTGKALLPKTNIIRHKGYGLELAPLK